MAQFSKIEWVDATFNPWIGCQSVSPGCLNCYAEAYARRWNRTKWGPRGQRVRTSNQNWRTPVAMQRNASAFFQKNGRRQRLFCASLADVFDNRASVTTREDLWELIGSCPDLDWLLLTKRPQNILRMLPADWDEGYPNVWLGVTAETQALYDLRWPILADIPATIHFISYEPALSPLFLSGSQFPDWLISGGESGPGARVMDPRWIRAIRDQCRAEGVAFFHKQWGSAPSNPINFEGELKLRRNEVDLFGKGGALLDGRLYREFPA